MVDKVSDSKQNIFLQFADCVDITAKFLIELTLQKCIYWNFHLKPNFIMRERLKQFYALPFATPLNLIRENRKIETLYLSSDAENKTGNVVIFCWNIPFQVLSKKRWEPLLKRGADIVLWNPSSSSTPFSYSEDLIKIIEKIQEIDPNKIITLVSYCASSDPAIRAISTFNNRRNIHLIIDRGHGDIYCLVRSFTFLASIPIVQSILEEKFDCKGREKISQINGKILFLYPKGHDQICDYGYGRNLTEDLRNLRAEDEAFEMENEDHWSSWGLATYSKILDFLERVRVVAPSSQPLQNEDIYPSQPASCGKTKILHSLKSMSFFKKEYAQLP